MITDINKEDQEKLNQVMEDLKEAFPGASPFTILPMLMMIDVKEWKFPNEFHEKNAIANLPNNIEKNEALKELFQRKASEN